MKMKTALPGVLWREDETRILSSLLDVDRLPSSIFVCGHPGTGKSYVLKQLLQSIHVEYAILSCVECYSTRLLWEQILSQLESGDLAEKEKCDTFLEFILYLQSYLKPQEPVVIVLEGAERLRNLESNTVAQLLRLQDVSQCNICCILVSCLPWDPCFASSIPQPKPVEVFFPQYSKDEVVDILCLDRPNEYPKDFYAHYLHLLLNVFYVACRNLRELRQLSKLNFAKYCEPVEKGEASMDDLRKLWRNIEPYLKKAMQSVYLREVSSAQWEEGETTSTKITGVELPYYSKFLLIAAYLASYNPSVTDKKFFMKNSGKLKQRKNVLNPRDKERGQQHLVGPKPFPLERMLAIFYSIVEEKIVPNALLYSQISSLATLKLLMVVRSGDLLDGAKYKCVASLSFLKQISKTVGFDIMQYLHDFA